MGSALTAREETVIALSVLVVILLVALGYLLHKGTTGKIEFGIFFRRSKNGNHD